MTKSDFPEARLTTPRFEIQTGYAQIALLVIDWDWWAKHENEVYEWMDERLPGGRAQCQGTVIQFNNEQDRLVFLMKWS
jgi:hypothetical protein